MARRLGSKNKPKDDWDSGYGDDSGEPLRNTVSGKELRGFIERIEYVNEQQKEIQSDRSQILKELKTQGYDRDTVRAIVKRRKLTEEQREAADALLEQYLAALGDFATTALGEAGASRMRGEAWTE
jgi:uncharacterized protein (UPF0335 family)